MQRLALLIGGALVSQALCLHALAQEPGPGTTTPPAYQKVSPEDKAAGKAQRREAGRVAAKAGPSTGEGAPPAAAQAKIPKEQRQQARAQRKAETARAARAGEIQAGGEVNTAK